MSQGKTGKETNATSLLIFKERTSPYRTFMFYALVGSSILFMSMVIMFMVWITHNEPIENFHFPKTFILGTLLLLFSSYTTTLSQHYYKEDSGKYLLLSLSSTLIFSLAFVMCQVLGWKSLFDQGFYLNGDAGIAFVYVITGLHFIHVSVGMIYLLYLNLKVFDLINDPVRSLLYFSNQFEGIRLDLFATYWHFIDGLWLFLFLTFLFIL
ncbi:MAG: cytochrome c oxidase subunit 3 [Bacteroidetes bacterium]|nr:cytochrome c oxidase subunit 3 [Bacteroidota bacterium]MBL0097695.1 cytochrome c oxidase subunit 3 [Bacteroidota bacterium]